MTHAHRVDSVQRCFGARNAIFICGADPAFGLVVTAASFLYAEIGALQCVVRLQLSLNGSGFGITCGRRLGTFVVSVSPVHVQRALPTHSSWKLHVGHSIDAPRSVYARLNQILLGHGSSANITNVLCLARAWLALVRRLKSRPSSTSLRTVAYVTRLMFRCGAHRHSALSACSFQL
jgi:hypothetical protein